MVKTSNHQREGILKHAQGKRKSTQKDATPEKVIENRIHHRPSDARFHATPAALAVPTHRPTGDGQNRLGPCTAQLGSAHQEWMGRDGVREGSDLHRVRTVLAVQEQDVAQQDRTAHRAAFKTGGGAGKHVAPRNIQTKARVGATDAGLFLFINQTM